MTEEDYNIANSTMRGDNVGEPYLADDEYICPHKLDYISDSPESVYYHMLSSHSISGDREEWIDEVTAVSSYYRDHTLPGYEEQESCDDSVEEYNQNILTRFIDKIINPF